MKYYLITYKNWKDEVSDRCILPISIEFGSNEYHKTPTWLIKAHDVDIKNENGAVSISVSNNLKTFDINNILEVKETKDLNINQVDKYVFDNNTLSKFTEDQDKIDFLTGTLELEINQNLKEKVISRKTLDNLCRWNDEEKLKIENLRARLEDINKDNQEKASEINNLYSTIKKLDEMVRNLVDNIHSLEYKSDQLNRNNAMEISNLIKQASSLYKQKADDSYHISKLIEKESRFIQKENNPIDLMNLSNKRNSLLNELNDVLVNNNLNEKFLADFGILTQKEVFVEHKPKFEVKSGTKCEKSFGEIIESFEVPRIRASQAYSQQVKDDLINKIKEYEEKQK